MNISVVSLYLDDETLEAWGTILRLNKDNF